MENWQGIVTSLLGLALTILFLFHRRSQRRTSRFAKLDDPSEPAAIQAAKRGGSLSPDQRRDLVSRAAGSAAKLGSVIQVVLAVAVVGVVVAAAFVDPLVRTILLITACALVLVLVIAFLVRRRQRESLPEP